MAPSTSNCTALLTSLLPPCHPHQFISLPVSPRKLHLSSHEISSLSVHPVLESALHILNMDLPSAHFLLRHMQAPPAWEAMYLHGILHRIEGDVENARAWYGEVAASEVFEWVWGNDALSGEEWKERDGNTAMEESTGTSVAVLGPPSIPSDEQSKDDSRPVTPAFRRANHFLDQVTEYKATLLSSNPDSRKTPSRQPSWGEERLSDISQREILRLWSFCKVKFGTDTVPDASGIWVSMAEKHADKAAEMITGGEGWREF